MTDIEWLTSRLPRDMMAWLAERPGRDRYRGISPDQLRSWVRACRWFADGHSHDHVYDIDSEAGLRVAVDYWTSRDGEVACPLALRADLLREVVGNPWRPVWHVGQATAWGTQPESAQSLRLEHRWLTPQVLSLAAAAAQADEVCQRCLGMGTVDRGPIGGPDRDDGKLYIMSPPDLWDCPTCHGTGHTGVLLDADRLAVLADALLDEGCQEQAILTHLRSPGPHVRGCHMLAAITGQ